MPIQSLLVCPMYKVKLFLQYFFVSDKRFFSRRETDGKFCIALLFVSGARTPRRNKRNSLCSLALASLSLSRTDDDTNFSSGRVIISPHPGG